MRQLTHEKLDVYQRATQFLALSAQLIDAMPKGDKTLVDQLPGRAFDRTRRRRSGGQAVTRRRAPPLRHRSRLSTGMWSVAGRDSSAFTWRQGRRRQRQRHPGLGGRDAIQTLQKPGAPFRITKIMRNSRLSVIVEDKDDVRDNGLPTR